MTRRALVLPAALIAGALALSTPASAAAAPAASPVSVAVVLPLTVPPTSTGLIDAETLATYTRPDGLLVRALDAVSGTRTAIGLDPMIPASIRVLGTSAPAEALDFLDRLRALPNDVFLLGYADADPALAVAAGTAGEFAPLGFGFAIDPADFGPAQTPSATPEPTPTTTPGPDEPEEPEPPQDGPPPLPDTSDLLDWPTTLPTIAWPAEGAVAADAAEGLAGLGYEYALLGESNVSRTATAVVDLGELDGLVVDDELTAAVRAAVYAVGEVQYEAAAVSVDAALTSESIASPGRTLIATLDRNWPVSDPRLAQVLSAITASPSAQVVSLSEALSSTRGRATLVDPAQDDASARATTIGELADAAREETVYLRIADDPTPITEPRRLAILGLSAAGWRADQVGWEAAATGQLDAARATLDAVQIVEGSDQLLLSDISSLRLPVSNALPVGVTVTLNVRPLRPLLHIEDQFVEVAVEPESTATATVPVEAIINGDLTVRAQLRDARGDPVGPPRMLKVIVQAGWETVGTLIAGTLVVLIFGGGLVRAVLRRRRGTAAEDDG